MLAFAFMNRFYLTPQLALPPSNGIGLDALRQLTRNSAVEIALGSAILAIVGMLGTMQPRRPSRHRPARAERLGRVDRPVWYPESGGLEVLRKMNAPAPLAESLPKQ